MSSGLMISITIFSFFLLLLNIELLKKGRIPIKFSLLWLISSLVLFFIVIFPNFMECIQKQLGFQTLSNMIIGILISIIIFLTLALTVIVSGQKSKIQLLIQEISILKKRVDDVEDDK